MAPGGSDQLGLELPVSRDAQEGMGDHSGGGERGADVGGGGGGGGCAWWSLVALTRRRGRRADAN